MKDFMKQTKILTVLAVSVAMGLAACGAKTNPSGGSGGASGGGDGSSKHTHSWGEWTEVTPATCTEAGSKTRTCSGCDEVDTQSVPALGHNLVESSEEYPQEGVKYLECDRCFAGALQWAAKDYDKSSVSPEATASDGSVRFSSNVTKYENGELTKRSTLVYKIHSEKAVAKAGLAFEIEPSSYNREIFDAQDDDSKPGDDIDAEGNKIAATKRYGLWVNGNRVQLGQDPGASTEKKWYDWPVEFPLKAGENEIELVCMGGYRAKMYNFRHTNMPHYEHKGYYEVKVAEEAAGEGFIKTETYACTQNCGKTAIRWSALDYDQTKTAARSGTDKGPESRDSGKAIRFSDEVQFKADQDSTTQEWIPNLEKKGCHIVFNVKTPAVQNVGLAMYSTARNDVATAFDKYEGDTAKGYEYNSENQLERPASRYGLKIDGKVYMLEANGEGWHGTDWYELPVRIPALEAGIHEFEIYNFGGYRVDMYNFQLIGCPAVQGSTFDLDAAEWKSDANGHWKELDQYTGVKFLYHEHVWGEDPDNADVAGTCDTAGVDYMKCKVCGKTDHKDIPAGHDWVVKTTVKNSYEKDVNQVECSRCKKVGAQMAVKDFEGNTKTDATYKFDNNTTVVYKIVVTKAGDYKLEIGAFVANNRTKDLSVTPYTVKLGTGDAAADVPVSSGTYEALGIGTSSAAQFVLCPTITLAQGENVISITQGAGGYRLTFGGTVGVFEK